MGLIIPWGEGGAVSPKHEVHEGSDFKHAPDLTVRLSKVREKKVRNMEKEEGKK